MFTKTDKQFFIDLWELMSIDKRAWAEQAVIILVALAIFWVPELMKYYG